MKILHNVSLKPYNTFGIDARAAHWVEVTSLGELRDALKLSQGQPMMVLGGGSNILLTQDFQGWILKMNLGGMEIVEENDHEVVVAFGAGEEWHACVMTCISNGWGGIENMALIPGCVGAAPIQNIGAYGRELKDVFAFLEAMQKDGGELRRFEAEECAFGYRDSVFKQKLKGKFVITKVAMRLRKKGHQVDISYGAITDELKVMGIDTGKAGISEVAKAVMNIRRSKLPDPKVIGNAGSFFKNPEISKVHLEALKEDYPQIPSYFISETRVKVPAGWLIEQSGWKGKRFSNYGVHDKQALVLVNHGGAKGGDIFDLSTQILVSVKEKFGIELEREVNVV